MAIIRSLLSTLPFILMCLSLKKVNLSKTDREKQFLMIFIALIYSIIMIVFLDKLNHFLINFISFLGQYMPIINNINISEYIIYIFNVAVILVYEFVKSLSLAIIKRTCGKYQSFIEKIAGFFYEYDSDLDLWFVKQEYGNVKLLYNGIYVAAIIVSSLLFILCFTYSPSTFFNTVFYPAFGIILLGEIVFFLSGITKSEFIEDILGEDEESYKVANYGLLRNVLKDLFEEHVLYDMTIDNGLDFSSSFDTIDHMCENNDKLISSIGYYFKMLNENGVDVDVNYAESCVKLIKGQSTMFANPFYYDLTNYLMLPMMYNLMHYKKCLVILGRDSSAKDVQHWLKEGVYQTINTNSLWKVDILGQEETNTDIGIMKFCDLYNLNLQKNNKHFLENVGFVFIIEPSHILGTGQVGLSILANRFKNHKVVYGVCDRNCDGLVDTLSHILKTNITEVTATLQSKAVTSMMFWKAESQYMHHHLFSNVSHYLGIGTEINSVALKYQIANTQWISNNQFPVVDMKWIDGQYFKKICHYANLTVNQESFNKAFHVKSNLWDLKMQNNSFLVVEDEFYNLFEMARIYSTRAKQQGFINVISNNYLLRDYMIDNSQTFLNDPKAIPTIVPEYAKTEKNVILKIIMRLVEEHICEDEIINIFMISGIEFTDVLETLKKLIHKHCFVDEIVIRVYFKDTLLSDSITRETKKYYYIDESTEIYNYAKNLKNAYYITEDETGDTHHIGAKLYGHVFQSLIPGQFTVIDGKYYEIESITPYNGVVVRRAAEHITGRKYYRQIRDIQINNWINDDIAGSQKDINGIEISKGYCYLNINTLGYIEMESYEDFKNAKRVFVNNIPYRTYRNKLVMKLKIPNINEKIKYTLCILLNEIFKTVYPDSYNYICATTKMTSNVDLPENFKYALYSISEENDEGNIYIIEDSEIDLGLISSIERNIKRYLEIITEVLIWHDMKMHEVVSQESEDEYIPVFEDYPKLERKPKGIIARLKFYIKKVFKKQKEENINTENEYDNQKSSKTENIDQEDEVREIVQEDKKIDGNDTNIEGDNENQSEIDTEDEKELTEYQKANFLQFGYGDYISALDLDGTREYLISEGYSKNPLSQTRSYETLSETHEKEYDPNKIGTHFCDFCGCELAGGEYEVLKDGRERCNTCSSTAVRTEQEFKQIFKVVLRNMEIFYGIKFNKAIKVRMTDAKKIAKHFNEEFIATPGFDGRVLGFAQKDNDGYSIYIENGSPKLAAMATIAHELTHIWQYLNWNEKEINAKYGRQNSLEVYEGMAKWAEIQYLLFLNEIGYAKRQEIITKQRNDEYGRGFIKFYEKYGLSYNQSKKNTPFDEKYPL